MNKALRHCRSVIKVICCDLKQLQCFLTPQTLLALRYKCIARYLPKDNGALIGFNTVNYVNMVNIMFIHKYTYVQYIYV